jgi:integration host factor subunit alpha
VNKNNLTKIDIIKNLSKKTGFSILFSKKLINDFLDIIINQIKANELNLKNIGSFKLVKKKERLGRNPKTKEEFIISARKTLRYVASKKLLTKIK